MSKQEKKDWKIHDVDMDAYDTSGNLYRLATTGIYIRKLWIILSCFE
jgi:hypothetical protein